MPKYDKFNRPINGPSKNWAVARLHGRGKYRYETQEEAEHHAERLARQYQEPVVVWKAIAEYEPDELPIKRTAID